MLAYEVGGALIEPHPGLHIHNIGPEGDVIDGRRHIRDAYDLTPGDYVLVRPDGFVGAIFGTNQSTALETYLSNMGVIQLENKPKIRK